jgi:hypothetical protein
VALSEQSVCGVQVRHFAEDPLNFVGDVRARTANEILKGFRDVQRKEALLTLPILAIHGTADKITSYTVRVLTLEMCSILHCVCRRPPCKLEPAIAFPTTAAD